MGRAIEVAAAALNAAKVETAKRSTAAALRLVEGPPKREVSAQQLAVNNLGRSYSSFALLTGRPSADITRTSPEFVTRDFTTEPQPIELPGLIAPTLVQIRGEDFGLHPSDEPVLPLGGTTFAEVVHTGADGETTTQAVFAIKETSRNSSDFHYDFVDTETGEVIKDPEQIDRHIAVATTLLPLLQSPLANAA